MQKAEISRDGSILATFFVSSQEFSNPEEAKKAWEHIHAHMKAHNVDLGVFRHGTTERNGIYVTVVSLDDVTVAAAEALLGGKENLLDPDMLQAIALRRADSMADAFDRDDTRTVAIRRGRRGAYLLPDGTMVERAGGQG